jgi:hypothetical protein
MPPADLTTLSSTCSHLRYLLAPHFFKSLQLRSSDEESAALQKAVAFTRRPLFRNNVTTLHMGDPTQELFQSSSIYSSVPNPAVALLLDSVGEMPLLRGLALFYMQLSVARLLLLVHGSSIVDLELHGIKVSETKGSKFSFSELQRRLTRKTNSTTIQRLCLDRIGDWYTVQSVVTEVKHSLRRLEVRGCEQAFMSQGILPRLSAVDTLVYDSGDTLLESRLELGELLRSVPALATLQLSGRSMRSIENATLPLTLQHLSVDYITLRDNVAEFIAGQRRAGKLNLPSLTSLSLLKCHDFLDLLDAVPIIRSTLPLVSHITLEIDWEQRGSALLLARMLPSIREIHLIIHTKTPLIQDWNEYMPAEFLSVVGTSVLTHVDRLSIEVKQERWDINTSVHVLMNWCTSVVEVDVDVDTLDGISLQEIEASVICKGDSWRTLDSEVRMSMKLRDDGEWSYDFDYFNANAA